MKAVKFPRFQNIGASPLYHILLKRKIEMKRILTLFLAVITVLSLSACGTDTDSPGSTLVYTYAAQGGFGFPSALSV